MQTTHPRIKAENWEVLAKSVFDVLNVSGNEAFALAASEAFKSGRPGALVLSVVFQCRQCISWTFNAQQAKRAKALLETFRNYGLIDDKGTLL